MTGPRRDCGPRGSALDGFLFARAHLLGFGDACGRVECLSLPINLSAVTDRKKVDLGGIDSIAIDDPVVADPQAEAFTPFHPIVGKRIQPGTHVIQIS